MNPRRWLLTKTIDVEIYGQRYSITGEAEESYVKKLAELVDSQMKHVAAGLRTATPTKLAVLAAINIAHELMECERKSRQGEADADRRVASLMESIDQQMPSILSR
jgi:cell division protein ZapA